VSTINTQLYFRIDQGPDFQLGDVNVISDGTAAARHTIYYGGGNDSSTTAGSGFGNETAIAVDTAAGLVFSVGDGNAGSFDGFQVHNLYTGALISHAEFGANTGSALTDDVVQSLAIDSTTRTVYVNDWGFDASTTGIRQFTYDTSGNLTDNGFLVTQAQNLDITDAIAMYVDVANHKLYYVDDDSGYDFAPFNATNGVYVLDLNNPTTSIQLTSNGSGAGQFPTADQSGSNTFIGDNGNIVGLAVDVADGIVFFESTDNQGSSNNALWWVDANGGANQTAHQITLPAGVTLNFAGQSSQGGNAAGLSFDPVTKQIYLTDAENSNVTPDTGHLYVLQWNNSTKTVSSVTSFDTATLVGTSPGTVSPFDAIGTTTLDDLPMLTTSGTATHAVEQGANVTLLSPAPTITDPDGNHLTGATVQITAGTFSSNETSATDDHLTIDSAHRTGTATSGTINGTSISYSYNSATEKLTLSGYDTLTDYQTALSFVQYFTTGDNPSNYGNNTTRTVTWHVNDGAIGDPSGTNTTTTTLNIDGKNDAPVASAPASYVEQEGVAKNLHNASLNVSDVDGGIAGQNETATLSVTEGTLHAVAGTGTSLGVGISGDGTSTLTITGTVAQINGLLNGDGTSVLTHTGHVDANDTPNSITLSLSVNDNGFNGVPPPGAQTSNTATSTITAPDDTSVTFTGLSGNTSGSPVEGQQITATIHDAGVTVGSATYTWKVNGTTVQTGSSNTFTPTESNEGGALTLDVAFNDPNNASIAESDTNISVGSPSTVQENAAENASIAISGLTSGNAVEGTQLTATVTDADAPASGITYTWKVNNVTVHTGVDAAGNTYTPTENDEGSPISVSVSFTDTHGNAGETGTASAGTVQESPTENASIAISGLTAGNAVDGTQLTATVTEPDAPAAGITYTWKVNNVVVHTGVDAAGKTYTPTENDENSPISVSASFTDTHGFSETGTASAGTVQENPTENASIAISGLTTGNAVEGTQLTATVTESDAPGSGITYTWKVNNVVVHTGVDGAGNTYTPTENDEGSPIGVAVSFTDTHGFSESGSASAGTVQESPTENASISISGQVSGHPQDGHQLTATVTEPDAPASGITYTWTSNNVPVHTGVDGAGNTYTPTGSDDGHTIAVSVSFIDTHGFAEQGSASAGVDQNPLTGHMVLTSATEGTTLANSTAVATFTDTNLSDMAGDFTATIDWGDGVTTSGTVAGSSGTFTVDGGHTYTDEGTDTAVVTLTHTSDHVQSTTSGPVAVAEGDHLTPHDITAAIVVNQPFSGQIGHFTDTDTFTAASDFVATIDWGDGATTSGTVSGGSGSFDVNGTHAYTTTGMHNVHVTLTDDAPGTATATADAKIVFNQSNGNHASAGDLSAASFLSSDGTGPAGQTVGEVPDNWDMIGTGQFSGPGTDGTINTDALFLSDSGGVVIWQSQNGVVTTDQFVGQLPTDYHFAGIADFDGDGKSDVLWQQDGGNVVMWEMNGTQVTANQVVGQVPSNWHISGTADVNGDGMSDIILTSDAGAQRVWEMNGTQVIADQPYDPNAPLATHVLDTHVTDGTPPLVAPAPIVAGGLAGTLGGLSVHDAHFLV